MADAVRAINAEVRALAPVIVAPAVADVVSHTAAPEAPLAVSCRDVDGIRYVFAVGMSQVTTEVTFEVAAARRIDVLGEERSLEPIDGTFADTFDGYAVHLYRIERRPPAP